MKLWAGITLSVDAAPYVAEGITYVGAGLGGLLAADEIWSMGGGAVTSISVNRLPSSSLRGGDTGLGVDHADIVNPGQRTGGIGNSLLSSNRYVPGTYADVIDTTQGRGGKIHGPPDYWYQAGEGVPPARGKKICGTLAVGWGVLVAGAFLPEEAKSNDLPGDIATETIVEGDSIPTVYTLCYGVASLIGA